jgi:hypothetical protein
VSESKGLSLVKRAGQMLAEARTLEEFKTVRDVGEAAIRLAKSRRDVGIEALLDAQEIVRRVERKLGAMLPEVTGGRGGDRKSKVTVTLDSIGIDGNQSKRFQKIAQLPEHEFEAWVSQCRESGEELTQAAALRLAAEFLADPIETPAKPPHEEMAAALKNAVTKFIGQLSTHEEYAYVRRRIKELLAFLSEMESENAVGRSGKTTARARAG